MISAGVINGKINFEFYNSNLMHQNDLLVEIKTSRNLTESKNLIFLKANLTHHRYRVPLNPFTIARNNKQWLKFSFHELHHRWKNLLRSRVHQRVRTLLFVAWPRSVLIGFDLLLLHFMLCCDHVPRVVLRGRWSTESGHQTVSKLFNIVGLILNFK